MLVKTWWVATATILLLVGCESTAAAGETPAMSRAEFDELMRDNSNWGRWGKDDEQGTLNFITREKRRDAAWLVQEGVAVSLALELNKHKDELNANPFEHEIETVEWGGHQWAGDTYSVNYHGFAHSHMDGLQHVAHKGMLYNGLPFDSLTPLRLTASSRAECWSTFLAFSVWTICPQVQRFSRRTSRPGRKHRESQSQAVTRC